jgi:hypothetical protein
VLRLVHNGFSGLAPEFDGLHARPEAIPPSLDLRTYDRTYRGTRYRVTYARGPAASVTADGQPVPPGRPLPLCPGGTVEVVIPRS